MRKQDYFIQYSRQYVSKQILENQLDFIKEHSITGRSALSYFNLLYSQFGTIDHMEVLNCKDKTKIVVGSFYGSVDDGLYEASKITKVIKCKNLYSDSCTSMFFKIKGRPYKERLEVIHEL